MTSPEPDDRVLCDRLDRALDRAGEPGRLRVARARVESALRAVLDRYAGLRRREAELSANLAAERSRAARLAEARSALAGCPEDADAAQVEALAARVAALLAPADRIA